MFEGLIARRKEIQACKKADALIALHQIEKVSRFYPFGLKVGKRSKKEL